MALTVLDELHRFLDEHLPAGWGEAVRTGDSEQVAVLAETLDNPAFVRLLGRAGLGGAPARPGARRPGPRRTRGPSRRWRSWTAGRCPHVPRGSGLPLAAPTIVQWSSEATKRRLLPPLVTGEERWCQLFSEPGAGSDLASLATTAVRDGDEWVVNGQKVWTTYGHESELAMLLARTDPGVAKHQGITYFGVDMRAPGRRGPAARPDDRRARVQRGVPHRRAHPRPATASARSARAGRAAQTTLGAERHALSGRPHEATARDEILGGKTIDDVLALATQARAQAPGPVDGVQRDRTVRR